VFFTEKGWKIVNESMDALNTIPCPPSTNSRIEIIAKSNDLKNISGF
jgi:hypothetical protein